MYIHRRSDRFKVSKFINVKMKIMFINIDLIKPNEKLNAFVGEDQEYL